MYVLPLFVPLLEYHLKFYTFLYKDHLPLVSSGRLVRLSNRAENRSLQTPFWGVCAHVCKLGSLAPVTYAVATAVAEKFAFLNLFPPLSRRPLRHTLN